MLLNNCRHKQKAWVHVGCGDGLTSNHTYCTGGQGRVRASVITHMDPHIKHVPAMLLNFVLKVMSPFIFGTIQKVLKSEFSSPDKVLPCRMREKPELYGLVSPRIAEYIHQLQEEESLLAQL